MSIFNRQVQDLNYDDIDELMTEGMRENIRLEFKEQAPSKNEIIKKISSFANTYGGYIIMGAGEDGKGNLSSLNGIDPIPSYNQTIIQYCYDNIYPPITPEVSNPIPHPEGSGKVFYVIYVEESNQTPHFLNGRKGCYIRTDEFSQKFEPRLAKYEEIQHLANRRQEAIKLRDNLINRAQKRFNTHVDLNYRKAKRTIGDIDVIFEMNIIPRFPNLNPLKVADLSNALYSCQTNARGIIFPCGEIQSHYDGFFFDNPRSIGFSYLEASIYRSIFYAQEMGQVNKDPEKEKDASYKPDEVQVYMQWILSQLIFYMKYSEKFYRSIGYDGSLYIKLSLDKIRGRRFLIPIGYEGDVQLSPMLDDNFSLIREIPSREFQRDILKIIKDIYRTICFSCGCKEVFQVSDADMDQHIDLGLKYLFWNRKNLLL